MTSEKPTGSSSEGHTQGPTHSTHVFDVPRRGNPNLQFTPKESPKEPPKIDPIPKINPPEPMSRPSPASLAKGLEGKYVDEFGNILDWNGTVLGRVDGDLPSMVGRPVSENGEIQDADGEVVGHVSENYAMPPLKELDGGLRVDGAGNIYNQDGTVIGKLNEPPVQNKESSSGQDTPRESSGNQKCSCNHNAPKPASAPSPSEIYLDVKSTFDGIQIIIKVPTIFNQENDQSQRPQSSPPQQSQQPSPRVEEDLEDDEEEDDEEDSPPLPPRAEKAS